VIGFGELTMLITVVMLLTCKTPYGTARRSYLLIIMECSKPAPAGYLYTLQQLFKVIAG